MRKSSTGILALAAIGAFYLFRNRETVLKFLDRQGIKLDTANLGESLRVNASKVVDRFRSKTEEITEDKVRQIG